MTGDFAPTTNVDGPMAKKAVSMTIFKGLITGDVFLFTSVADPITEDITLTAMVGSLMARATTLIADSIGSVVRATISIAGSNSLVAKPLAPTA